MKTPWATDVALNLSRLMEKTWTLQKFAPGEDGDANPVLTDRRNVVVVADEAHRSQYGFGETLDRHGRLRSGLAKHMRDALPGATYLGFTGTPIESNDKSTRSVFGDCIDVYDLTRAVEDGATFKIFYESRLAKIDLSDDDLAALGLHVPLLAVQRLAGELHGLGTLGGRKFFDGTVTGHVALLAAGVGLLGEAVVARGRAPREREPQTHHHGDRSRAHSGTGRQGTGG